MHVRIYAVDEIEHTILRPAPGSAPGSPLGSPLGSAPQGLLVAATGRVVSSGWSAPALTPWFYATPPEDGIQAFDLVAEPPVPGSTVLPALAPIRAEALLTGVDLDNFWGPGCPLVGVRVQSGTNAKTGRLDAAGADRAAAPALAARRSYAAPPAAPPGFSAEIGPLFRDRDIEAMDGISGFRLGTVDDVRAHSASILERLEDGSMPCDGPWPREDVAQFRAWVEGGMPA